MTDTVPPTGTVAEAAGVTRRFGGFTAVGDVSMNVAAGEIVGLIGANGAGKTTLIRILLGLLPATAGRVWLFGQAPSREMRQRLGYVPQGIGLYADLTVAENLQFTAQAFGAKTPASLPDELAEAQDRLVGDIGRGLQRQLAFIAALAHSPELLVLDEPTSGVDPLARSRLWDTIHEQADQGVGVLVTTHYMQEAEQCDRLVIMVAGRVAVVGTVGDIVGDRSAVRVDTHAWEQALRALADAHLPALLAGRSVRVPDVAVDDVERVLRDARVAGHVTAIPATLEETLMILGKAAAEDSDFGSGGDGSADAWQAVHALEE